MDVGGGGGGVTNHQADKCVKNHCLKLTKLNSPDNHKQYYYSIIKVFQYQSIKSGHFVLHQPLAYLLKSIKKKSTSTYD